MGVPKTTVFFTISKTKKLVPEHKLFINYLSSSNDSSTASAIYFNWSSLKP